MYFMLLEIIFALLIGVLLGNFGTTLVYRLPRGITIAGFDKDLMQPPMCSFCYHKLRFYEFLPLINLITTGGKCNYCGHSIPYEYLALEAISSLLSLIFYFIFGFGDLYILVLLFSVNATISIIIYNQYHYVDLMLSTFMVFFGVIFQLLNGAEFSTVVLILAITSIFSMAIAKNRRIFKTQTKPLIHVLFTSVIWIFNVRLYLLYMIALGIFYIFLKSRGYLKFYSYASFLLLPFIIFANL